MFDSKNNDEYIVSINPHVMDLALNEGKWSARFTISRYGKILYYGTIIKPVDSKIEAERVAAAEACRVLSNGARLLY